MEIDLSHAPAVHDFLSCLLLYQPDGDRLRETISVYTWLSSIGRWLIDQLSSNEEKHN